MKKSGQRRGRGGEFKFRPARSQRICDRLAVWTWKVAQEMVERMNEVCVQREMDFELEVEGGRSGRREPLRLDPLNQYRFTGNTMFIAHTGVNTAVSAAAKGLTLVGGREVSK